MSKTKTSMVFALLEAGAKIKALTEERESLQRRVGELEAERDAARHHLDSERDEWLDKYRSASAKVWTLTTENERLRAALKTMVAYAKYEVNELPLHHPTLPSAISAAEAALSPPVTITEVKDDE